MAEINGRIELAALANEDTLPSSDHIVIGDWGGSGFSGRGARCGGGVSTCAANEPGGAEGNFLLKAAIVGKHNKILARSSTLVIIRKPLSLALNFTDPNGDPESGSKSCRLLPAFDTR